MPDKIKIPRLGKAAIEFNVSTSTIVEFLSKKGLEIEDNGNTKLTQEMYTLIINEYQKEKDIKERSSEIEIGHKSADSDTSAQSPLEEEPVKKKLVEREPEPVFTSGEVFIKDLQLRPTVTDEVAKTISVKKPKVLDKIDLDVLEKSKKKSSGSTKSKSGKTAGKEQELPKETVQPEESGANVKESEISDEASGIQEELQVEEIKNKKPKSVTKKAADGELTTKPAKKTKAKNVEVAETDEAPADTDEPKDSSLTEPEPVKTETAVAEKAQAVPEEEQKLQEKSEGESEKENVLSSDGADVTQMADEDASEIGNSVSEEEMTNETTDETSLGESAEKEIFTLNKVSLKGVTTLGHINLDEINQSTKPKKKSAAERQKEKEQKKQEKLEQRKQQKEQLKKVKSQSQPFDNSKFVKTETPKLAGPKVIATIELDQSGDEADRESGGKKKRKRIKTYTEKTSVSSFEKEKGGKPKSKEKKSGKYKVDFTEEDITKQIRKTYSGMAPVKKTQASKHRKEKREHFQQEMMEEIERSEQEKSVLKVTEFITANELAIMMNRPVTDIISACMSLGLAVAINQRLSADTIQLLAENYGYTVQFVGLEEEEEKVEENPEDLQPRAPIITVMGHVDHGKTSLLDYIRNTNVIQGEAGGITQHIGAYEVKVGDRSITFLDTPGHEAFTAMRARGASITDIVIIVIAADDQIMPQTVEAINHAQAAGVPMIFAINKIDKPGADPEKIRGALANMNILVEEWGGKVQSQDISAKKGTNVDLLLEKVLIEAEMLDLKANPNAEPTGTVIESSLDKGRGYVAKILVQNGTLRTGDIIAAGTSYGKIRAMYNEKNQVVKEAGPSVPVLLLGLNSAPQAGDTFKTYKTDKEARAIVNKRSQLLREQGLRTQKHITLDELGRRIAVGDFKELNVIVKGDVDGSIEALSDEVLKLSTADVQVNVIHKSVGQVTESDVLLASASNAIIIAFQVRPSAGAKKLAEQEQVDIRVYSVIYSAIDDLKAAIAGMKAPELKETVVANLEVRETFHISKVGIIAGCYVMDGKVQRSSKVRVIRDGIVIHDNGRLGSLKRFKDDAKEVTAGLECGLNIESFNDVKVGDVIEAYEQVEVPAK